MSEFSGVGSEDPGRSEEERREDARFVALHNRELSAVRVALGRQVIVLRNLGIGLAMVVVGWALLLESALVYYIIYCKQKIDASVVLLTTAPLVCITVITAFVLMGIFRGFQSKDMGKLPAETVVKEFLSKNLMD